MKFIPTSIPGAYLIESNRFQDQRGSFVKTFQAEDFSRNGLSFCPAEEFYSISHRGVVRGMHFQTPPAAHAKVVYCLSGRILDVIVDLRKGSPTFGKFYSVELDASKPISLFIPVGLAHGFLSQEPESLVMYSVTSVHSPSCDGGIRWDSFGMTWPCADPIISSRDSGLPTLAEFDTPFIFSP